MQTIYNLRLVLIDQAAAKAFEFQTTMKTILKMTKEEMKREITNKRPTVDRLQYHGPMPTKTIDQIRLSLLTAVVYELY